MSTYAPGTVYRTPVIDGTHYTAVQLKDGLVMEVKCAMPIAGGPHKFADLDCWTTERGIDKSTLIVDTSKAYGVVIKADDKETHGFKYAKLVPEIYSGKNWHWWCYNIMAEGAPHLLTNTAVKDAFNALVDLMTEYKEHFNGFLGLHQKANYYDPVNLFNTRYVTEFGGIPIYCHYGSYNNRKPTEFYTKMKEVIKTAYVALYNLIKDDLTPFLQKRHGQMKRLENQSRLKRTINRLEKKKAQLEDSLESYKKVLAGLSKELEESRV